MQVTDYWFRESEKCGLPSAESYIIGRGDQVFLRVLGGEPTWQIMTATASEDDGKLRVFSDRARLVEAAFKICHRRNLDPISKEDLKGREYVLVGTLYRASGETNEQLNAALEELTREFFETLDADQGSGDQGRDEMIEIYHALSDGDDGKDIYLSDGFWLSSDGSMVDRGR